MLEFCAKVGVNPESYINILKDKALEHLILHKADSYPDTMSDLENESTLRPRREFPAMIFGNSGETNTSSDGGDDGTHRRFRSFHNQRPSCASIKSNSAEL